MPCDSEGRLRKRREASHYALYFLPTLISGQRWCRSRATARDRRAGTVGRRRSARHQVSIRTRPALVSLRRFTKVAAPHVGNADRDHEVIGAVVGRRERDAIYRKDRMPAMLGAGEL